MYTMGFYRLPAISHAGFDKHRSNFYWNAADNKRKYRMVRWKLICRPKKVGGLGILNTAVMNECLMIKWWWKIVSTMGSPNPKPLWYTILQGKYFPASSPLMVNPSNGSQFWRSIYKVRDVFLSFVKFSVHNGRSVCFWRDLWHPSGRLDALFPTLFSFCSDPDISIAELAAKDWDLGLRRTLSPDELVDWQRLVAMLPSLSKDEDEVSWTLTASSKFSVKSLYSALVGGRPTNRFSPVWRARVPPKGKMFLWQAFRGKLPASDQILKRYGISSDACCMSQALESTAHIFFHCHLALFFWSCLRS